VVQLLVLSITAHHLLSFVENPIRSLAPAQDRRRVVESRPHAASSG